MRTDGETPTPAGAPGDIEVDPDIVRFVEAHKQRDDTTLSDALGGATLPYTERYVTERTGLPASTPEHCGAPQESSGTPAPSASPRHQPKALNLRRPDNALA